MCIIKTRTRQTTQHVGRCVPGCGLPSVGPGFLTHSTAEEVDYCCTVATILSKDTRGGDQPDRTETQDEPIRSAAKERGAQPTQTTRVDTKQHNATSTKARLSNVV